MMRKVKDTTISFNLIKRIIILPVYVNHLGPLNFALDSGAGASVIANSTAKKLGLESLRKRHGIGAGGGLTLYQTTVNHLQLGEIELENFRTLVADLSALSSKLGIELNGIIGYDILRCFEVTISYKKKVIRLKQERRIASSRDKTKEQKAIALAVSSQELTPELLQHIKNTGGQHITLKNLPPQLKEVVKKKLKETAKNQQL
jgi:hypothetical protein